MTTIASFAVAFRPSAQCTEMLTSDIHGLPSTILGESSRWFSLGPSTGTKISEEERAQMLSHRLRSMPPICKYKGLGSQLGGFFPVAASANSFRSEALSQRHGVSAAKPLHSNARDLSSWAVPLKLVIFT